jgi:putative transcriptional regulator
MDDILFNELVLAVKEMKAVERGEIEPAKVTEMKRSDVTRIRQTLRLSQPKFAQMMGISVRTLQNWEQGHRHPTGPAKVLLRVAELHPEAVLDGAK